MKKCKIPGLSGPANCGLFLRLKGSKDYGAAMLVETQSGLTTPWLLAKAKNLETYLYGLVQDEAKAISPLHEEAAGLKHILDQMAKPTTLTPNREEANRRAAAMSAKAEHAHSRLAEIRARIQMRHLALAQAFHQAESLYHAKVMSYWSGLIKASSTEELPATPATVARIPEVEAVYLPTMNLFAEEA